MSGRRLGWWWRLVVTPMLPAVVTTALCVLLGCVMHAYAAPPPDPATPGWELLGFKFERTISFGTLLALLATCWQVARWGAHVIGKLQEIEVVSARVSAVARDLEGFRLYQLHAEEEHRQTRENIEALWRAVNELRGRSCPLEHQN